MTRTIYDCKCIKETTLAILIVDALGSEAWIPLSQVDDDSEVYSEGTEGDLIMSNWFYETRLEWIEK